MIVRCTSMPIQAVQHIHRMRGGPHSHLIRCVDLICGNIPGGLVYSRLPSVDNEAFETPTPSAERYHQIIGGIAGEC